MTDTSAADAASRLREAPTGENGAGGGRQPVLDTAELLKDVDLSAIKLPEPEAPVATPQPLAQRIARDIGTGILESPSRVVRGAYDALDSAVDLVTQTVTVPATRWLHENVVDLTDVAGATLSGQTLLGVPESLKPAKEAGSVTGEIVQGISQFATGYFMAGSLLKGLGVVQAGTTAGRIGQAMGQGAIADFVSFDAHEARLSNLVQQFPAMQNPVTEYLASSPEDTEAEGRLKNALEGFALGGAVEVLGIALRGLRATRHGDIEGAAKAADDLKGKVPERDVDLESDRLETPANDNAGTGAAPKSEATSPFEGTPPKTDEKVADGSTANDNAPQEKPKLPLMVDEDALRRNIDYTEQEFTWGQGRNNTGIRTDLIENGEDIQQILSATARAYGDEITKIRGGAYQSLGEVRKLADDLADTYGSNTDLIMSRVAARKDSTGNLAAELLAQRDLLATSTTKLQQIAELVSDARGPTGPYKDRAELLAAGVKAFEVHANLLALHNGIQTDVARALNALRIPAKAKQMDLQGIDASTLGEKQLQSLFRRIADADNPKAVAKLTRGGLASRFINSVNEYWINSLLSSPKTHIVNTLSGAAMTLYNPVERVLAGALTGNRAEIEGGLSHYVGLAMSVKDALRLAGRALKTSEAILDARGSTVEDFKPQITADNWGLKNSNNPVLSGAGAATDPIIDFLGKVVRAPSRFMTAEDEFFKQWNYRAHVRARAVREARVSGDTANIEARIQQALDDSVDAFGRATDKEALQYARSVTFSQGLSAATWGGGPTMGQSIQNALRNHPAGRLIVPFVRTPTNIIRWAWNHAPGLNLARAAYWRALTGREGGIAMGKARAEMATGGLLLGGAALLATEGKITGAGPANPEQRKLLEATGWKPFSLVTQNMDGSLTYTSYKRFDPFAMFFATVADFADIGGHLSEKEVGEVTTALLVAFTRQMQDKSYLTGLTNVLDALSQPERNMERYIRTQLAGFAPSIVRDLTGDPVVREARGLLDGFIAKTPFSASLAPQRNIFGEIVTPHPAFGPDNISPVVQDIRKEASIPTSGNWLRTPQRNFREETARLAIINDKAFRQPPREIEQGVDLTTFPHPLGYTAYDRYQELVGTLRLGGKTLTEQIDKQINTTTYRSRLTDGDDQIDGTRVQVLQRVISDYRDAAKATLIREMPELGDEIKAARMRKVFGAQGNRPQ